MYIKHVLNSEILKLINNYNDTGFSVGLGRVHKNSTEYPHSDNQPEFE